MSNAALLKPAKSVRTRKPKATAATLIATEYSQRTTPQVESLFTADEWAQTPAHSSASAPAVNSASPVILFFIVAAAAILLFRAALALAPVINYGIKKLLHFVSEQRGGKVVDFGVYSPIFEG
jgi:hypothetical protein